MRKNDLYILILCCVIMSVIGFCCEKSFAGRPGWIPEHHQPQMVNPNAFKNEDDVVEYLFQKVELFIDSATWCFTDNCDNQANVEAIGNMIESYGYSKSNYGVACSKDAELLELRIVIVSNINPDHKYLHFWYLYTEPMDDLDPDDFNKI